MGGRWGRPNHRSNLLRVCRKCHLRMSNSPTLVGDYAEHSFDLSHAIWLKMHQDPMGWDREWFEGRFGRPLPEPSEPLE